MVKHFTQKLKYDLLNNDQLCVFYVSVNYRPIIKICKLYFINICLSFFYSSQASDSIVLSVLAWKAQGYVFESRGVCVFYDIFIYLSKIPLYRHNFKRIIKLNKIFISLKNFYTFFFTFRS